MKNPSTDHPRDDILVVEDSLPSLQAVQNVLIEGGYKVRGATDGRTAMMIAQSKPPGLILLDVSLPGMDGFEVCQHLKSESETHEQPVGRELDEVEIEPPLEGHRELGQTAWRSISVREMPPKSERRAVGRLSFQGGFDALAMCHVPCERRFGPDRGRGGHAGKPQQVPPPYIRHREPPWIVGQNTAPKASLESVEIMVRW